MIFVDVPRPMRFPEEASACPVFTVAFRRTESLRKLTRQSKHSCRGPTTKGRGRRGWSPPSTKESL